MNIEVLWDGAYGLSSLSEKTRKSNHLQMSLQRQHFLFSYLKTLRRYIPGILILLFVNDELGAVLLNDNSLAPSWW